MLTPEELAQLNEWRKKGRHLPEWLRDFHNQKDAFKLIHHITQSEATDPLMKHYEVSWVQAHTYTIDCFLWVMARYGFTLQRCRANQPFASFDDEVAMFKDEISAAFRNEMTQRTPAQKDSK